MVCQKKKKYVQEKRKGFSGAQRYNKTTSERSESIAETTQTPETSTQDDDINNEPTCVGAYRKELNIADAKQPHPTGLNDDEYRLISLKNLNKVAPNTF